MERLTLEEAISHAKEVAKAKHSEATYATYNFPDLKQYYDNCLECAEQHEQLAKWLEELKSYKDAEEQSLLVRLPCKEGDTLFCIIKGTIKELRVHHFDTSAFGTTDIVFRYADGFKLERFIGKFGKTVFHTREEAKKKLEEMQNDKT